MRKVLLVAGTPEGEKCDAELSFELVTGVAEMLRKEGFKAAINADEHKAQAVEVVRILRANESHKADQIAESLDADAVLYLALTVLDIHSLSPSEPTGRIMKVRYEYDGNGLMRLLATEPATIVTFNLKAEGEMDGLSDFPHEPDEAKRQLARTAAVTNVFLSLRLAHTQVTESETGGAK